MSEVVLGHKAFAEDRRKAKNERLVKNLDGSGSTNVEHRGS